MKDTEAILKDLRNITMLTGEISSLHEKNLKTWVFVAFDGVENLEIKYDLSKDYHKEVGESYIDFYLEVEPMAVNEKFEERCKTLTGWVRDMLWNDIKVKIFINSVNQYTNSTKDLKTRKPDGSDD